ncbi:MAG: hypothetical protein N2C14_23110, partial [Planctomycetales bacterium]
EQEQDDFPGRKRIEEARKHMEEAKRRLEEAKRDGAADEQEEAIKQLEEAKAELEEILKQLREEELERVLAMLEQRFKEMLAMQVKVYEGTLLLDQTPEERRAVDRQNFTIRAGRLSHAESKIVLAAEKALIILREEGSAVAFPEVVSQMIDDMEQVVGLLAETKVGEITQGIEEDVIAALEEVIEALKKAQKEMEDDQPPPGEPPPPGPQAEPPLIDMLAELKMIKSLQLRVNRRTERYNKILKGERTADPDLLRALRELADRQERIYQVTRDIATGKNR